MKVLFTGVRFTGLTHLMFIRIIGGMNRGPWTCEMNVCSLKRVAEFTPHVRTHVGKEVENKRD